MSDTPTDTPDIANVDAEPVTQKLFDMGSSLTLPIVILIYSLCQTVQPKYSGLIYMGFLMLFIIVRKFIIIPTNLDTLTPDCTSILFTKGLTFHFFISLFTFLYVISPMLVYNNYNSNDVVILIVLGSYTLFTLYLTYKKNKCYEKNITLLKDILLALISVVGSFFFIFYLSPNAFLFSTAPNANQCPKPSKQKMVCSVHKNGELVKKFSS
jgi:TRAP-type uncharacterized transport system fused permease subunit